MDVWPRSQEAWVMLMMSSMMYVDYTPYSVASCAMSLGCRLTFVRLGWKKYRVAFDHLSVARDIPLTLASVVMVELVVGPGKVGSIRRQALQGCEVVDLWWVVVIVVGWSLACWLLQ